MNPSKSAQGSWEIRVQGHDPEPRAPSPEPFFFRSQGVTAWIVVLASLFLGVSEVAWAFGFSVDPARVEMAIPAGKRRGKTLTVKNSQSDAIHLRVYATDVVYLPNGTHEFPPAGSTEWSCASWIQVTPTELDVPAQSSREVRVSVIAPSQVSGGHYAMLFFETGPSYQEQGIGVNFRIGALVEAVIPGTEQRQIKFTDLSFSPPSEIRFGLFNEGNVYVRPKGKVKIFDASNKPVHAINFNPNGLGVFPKTLRSLTLALEQPLAPGTYRLRAEVDYGLKALLIGELPIQFASPNVLKDEKPQSQ